MKTACRFPQPCHALCHLLLLWWMGGLFSVLLPGGVRGGENAGEAEPPRAEFTAKERRHWAFQPVHRPAVPILQKSTRVRTPIDAFILRRLQQRGLSLRPAAGRRELIRRAKFDLLGLPPSPEEIDAFLADKRPDAYERLIEKFLASPQYGEAWGRLWLDLVRFAETAGFNADPPRPLAYQYRDYVIRSFNANKPYSRFLAEQIAGDELFPDNRDALIATGYNRMWPDESNASDILLARQDALNDLTANFGSVFLGLSLGCAQCHDHKFDPLLQSDFYRLQSFFAGIVLRDRVPLGTQQQLVDYQRRTQRWLDETAAVRKELHAIESAAKAKAGAVKRRKFPPRVLQAIDTAPEERTAYQWQLVFWSERQIELKEPQILKQMTPAQRRRRQELRQKLVALKKNKPQPPHVVDVMATVELPTGPAKTFLLSGGSYRNPEREVLPGYPVILTEQGRRSPDGCNPFIPAAVQSPRRGTSGRRSTLVRWMLHRRHPLTARVMVNRLWQGHFGKGLVSNANDFGTQTPPPSHPELLDWLADEFVRSGWDIKHMHRLIMTSAVYRQHTFRRDVGESLPKEAKVDPANTLYWHYPRQRLTSERIRDSLLFVAGKLSLQMYGPGIRPALPPHFSSRHSWKPSATERERNRRSVYIYAKRNLPYPLMKAFDFPDMHESCAKRPQTTIAPQALMLLNSEVVLDAARAMMRRILRKTPADDLPGFVRQAYVLAFGRPPQTSEIKAAVQFLQAQEAVIRREEQVRPASRRAGQKKPSGKTLAGTAQRSVREKLSPRERALVDFCHALLNANEFLFVE